MTRNGKRWVSIALGIIVLGSLIAWSTRPTPRAFSSGFSSGFSDGFAIGGK